MRACLPLTAVAAVEMRLPNTFKNRLCTTICKSVHSTRLSGNQDFGLAQHPTTTFAPKWAELRIRCGNDAPWDLRRNLCRRFVVRPTELGNPHQTRVSTFPQRLRRRLPRLAGEPTPLELRALSDSCTEPVFDRCGCTELVVVIQ